MTNWERWETRPRLALIGFVTGLITFVLICSTYAAMPHYRTPYNHLSPWEEYTCEACQVTYYPHGMVIVQTDDVRLFYCLLCGNLMGWQNITDPYPVASGMYP